VTEALTAYFWMCVHGWRLTVLLRHADCCWCVASPLDWFCDCLTKLCSPGTALLRFHPPCIGLLLLVHGSTDA
jgi:hypothetical protein